MLILIPNLTFFTNTFDLFLIDLTADSCLILLSLFISSLFQSYFFFSEPFFIGILANTETSQHCSSSSLSSSTFILSIEQRKNRDLNSLILFFSILKSSLPKLMNEKNGQQLFFKSSTLQIELLSKCIYLSLTYLSTLAVVLFGSVANCCL